MQISDKEYVSKSLKTLIEGCKAEENNLNAVIAALTNNLDEISLNIKTTRLLLESIRNYRKSLVILYKDLLHRDY